MHIAVGILLIFAAIMLAVSVLLQESKTEAVGGRTPGLPDRLLKRITLVAAVLFLIAVILSYTTQGKGDVQKIWDRDTETEAPSLPPESGLS